MELSVPYSLGHYSKQPLVDMAHAHLTCALKVKYMMYKKIETKKYQFL